MISKIRQYNHLIDNIHHYGKLTSEEEIRFAKLEDEVVPEFHRVFHDPYMKAIIEKMVNLNSKFTISGAGKTPEDIIHWYEELKALDEKMVDGTLHFIAYVHSRLFEEDENIKMYLINDDLCGEWCKRLSAADFDPSSLVLEIIEGITPENFILTEFIKDHANSGGLTTLWGGSFI